jgi:hypothetical protein
MIRRTSSFTNAELRTYLQRIQGQKGRAWLVRQIQALKMFQIELPRGNRRTTEIDRFINRVYRLSV